MTDIGDPFASQARRQANLPRCTAEFKDDVDWGQTSPIMCSLHKGHTGNHEGLVYTEHASGWFTHNWPPARRTDP